MNSIKVSPVVALKEGNIRGAVKQLNDGTQYYSFKGIRYAQAPVGKLRFKAPLPITPWEGIRDAIHHGSVCPQLDLQTGETLEGNEDCLFLNVYTTSLDANKKIPVMFFIHGGGFTSGSGNSQIYGPKFLLQHNVVIVTINYRLEVLGFLCLDTLEVPGNAGLKDQVAALRWVQNNICQFGGDPENVTIFGESAGGASVTYHMISPLSHGLFHKAISQSGVCLTDWAYEINAAERAFKVGKILGKHTNDPEELLQFLQSVPATDLISMTYKTQTREEKYRGLPIHFAPVVEKFSDKAFLSERPLDLMLRGKFYKVPFIAGYNSSEGMMMITTDVKRLNIRNQTPSYFVPRELVQMISEQKLKEFGDRIKQFYYRNRDLTEQDTEIICNINSDLHFVYGITKFAEYYSEYCKTIYLYRFNLDTELNFFKMILGVPSEKGACHADDLFYLFNNMTNKEKCEEQEKLRKLVYMMTKLWTDFAKTGNPTPDDRWGLRWRPYTDNKEYLKIDETLSMGKCDEKERIDFWDKLYGEAGIPSSRKCKI
ncbi:unnamed protein product, partial [Brenthis ino]